MKTRVLLSLLGGVSLLAAVPATAQAQQLAPGPVQAIGAYASQSDAINVFYAYRRDAPFWLNNGAATPAVTQLLTILRRATLDGLSDGPQLAAQAEAAISATQGDPAKVLSADRLLSSAWVRYVQAIKAPARGVEYAVPYLAPQPVRTDYVMFEAARAASLDAHLQATSNVNPLYAQLRDAAWQQMQATGGIPDPRVLGSLERMRIFPATGRFVLVDAASARLFVVEDGQIRDSMKVVVGMTEDKTHKPTPELHTPMIVSMIYYATFNPYWHVPAHLVPNIARGVLAAGVKALNPNRYQVIDGFTENPQILNPTTVNWKAVAAGQEKVALRQLPGPNNSMGVLKFQFPNSTGIYLHDTPHKEYFKAAQRTLSNGCIRLEDAKRLGRWLLGRDPIAPTAEPEQHVQLPQGVPVYVTYLTAQMEGDKLTFPKDVYALDSVNSPNVTALNNEASKTLAP